MSQSSPEYEQTNHSTQSNKDETRQCGGFSQEARIAHHHSASQKQKVSNGLRTRRELTGATPKRTTNSSGSSPSVSMKVTARRCELDASLKFVPVFPGYQRWCCERVKAQKRALHEPVPWSGFAVCIVATSAGCTVNDPL